MKNKYVKVSHISDPKFKEIVKLFSEDLSATQIIANLTNLNRNTISGKEGLSTNGCKEVKKIVKFLHTLSGTSTRLLNSFLGNNAKIFIR